MLLPTVLCPYMLIGFFVLVYFSVGNPVLEAVLMENRGFIVIALLGLFIFGAVIVAAVFFALALLKKWDSLFLSKAAMIIKVIHIPAYIAIFVLGVLFSVTVWLWAVVPILAFLDYVFLLMSGSITVAAVINSVKEGRSELRKNIWIIICQFIFCADVVAAAVLYFRSKKSQNHNEVDL